MSRTPVSVCMATYNGARYVAEQMASVLQECGDGDEIVVVDDGSRDDTLAIIGAFNDARIRILRNERNIGPQQSFGRALAEARHGILLMSDQDDVWIPGRLAAMVDALETSGADLLASNSIYTDAVGAPVAFPMPPLRAASSGSRLANLGRIFAGRAGYYGCTMALRREFRDRILPIPRFMESHDLWMAIAANCFGRVIHLEQPTLRRRIHGANVSVVHRPLLVRVRARVTFARAIALAAARFA